MQTRWLAPGISILLLVGCGGAAEEPGADNSAEAGFEASDPEGEPSETTAEGEGDDPAAPDAEPAEPDGQAGEPEEEPTEPEEPPAEPEEGEAGSPASEVDVAAALEAALTEYHALHEVDPDESDQHCTQLSEWSNVQAAVADLPNSDEIQHGGYLIMLDELESFGCGFARAPSGMLAVLITVERGPVEVPQGFGATTTAAGLDVHLGVGEIGDLVFYTGEPVSAAILTADGVGLHVTAETDVLDAEQLPPVIDAALADLAGLL